MNALVRLNISFKISAARACQSSTKNGATHSNCLHCSRFPSHNILMRSYALAHQAFSHHLDLNFCGKHTLCLCILYTENSTQWRRILSLNHPFGDSCIPNSLSLSLCFYIVVMQRPHTVFTISNTDLFGTESCLLMWSPYICVHITI